MLRALARDISIPAFLSPSPISHFIKPRAIQVRYFHPTHPKFHPTLTLRHFARNTKSYKPPRANVARPSHHIPHRIAVVGGGLAGLAVVYHLLYSSARFARKRDFDHETIRITLFDPSPPGTSGASAAAAGLLHDFRPRPKRKMWNHQKAIDASLHLIAQCETSGHRLIDTPGILKLAFTDRSVEDFQVAARRFPREVDFLEPHQLAARFPNAPQDVPGLFIKAAHVVDTIPYMQALWQLCQKSGRVTWSQQPITEVAQLFEKHLDSSSNLPFTDVVLCSGASITGFPDLEGLPITQALGRNLVMEGDHPAPDVPLLSGFYIVPHHYHTSSTSNSSHDAQQPAPSPILIAGSTHEPIFDQNNPYAADVDEIKAHLSEHVLKLVPNLYKGWRVTATQTGIKANPPRSPAGSVPIAVKVKDTPPDKSCWLLSGLGGRGLLYHAFLGRSIAHAVVSGLEDSIPFDARRAKVKFAPGARRR